MHPTLTRVYRHCLSGRVYHVSTACLLSLLYTWRFSLSPLTLCSCSPILTTQSSSLDYLDIEVVIDTVAKISECGKGSCIGFDYYDLACLNATMTKSSDDMVSSCCCVAKILIACRLYTYPILTHCAPLPFDNRGRNSSLGSQMSPCS